LRTAFPAMARICISSREWSCPFMMNVKSRANIPWWRLLTKNRSPKSWGR